MIRGVQGQSYVPDDHRPSGTRLRVQVGVWRCGQGAGLGVDGRLRVDSTYLHVRTADLRAELQTQPTQQIDAKLTQPKQKWQLREQGGANSFSLRFFFEVFVPV